MSANDNDDTTRKERKRAYETVVGIVDKNTGHGMPAMLALPNLLVTATHAGLYHDTAKAALRAAVSNGDLVEFDGRYACTDEESLVEARDWELDTDEPRKPLIGKLNEAIREARDDV